MMEDAFDEYALGGCLNVVLLDATHGTNKYNFKLACFTTVSSTGQTVILAATLLAAEDIESYQWSLECFAEVFRVPPKAFFTDSDESIAQAVIRCTAEGQCLHGMLHFLCTYHLSKNLWKHMCPLFLTKPEHWRAVHSAWWNLAKETDVRRVETFDAEWEAFVTLVQTTSCVREETTAAQVKWLEDTMYTKRHKWAARFTWSTTTWGVHSTQRAEALHSAIKRFLRAHMLLVTLVRALVQYNLTSRTVKQVDMVRKSLQHATQAVLPVVFALRDVITPFAYELVLSQASLATLYHVSEQTFDAPMSLTADIEYLKTHSGTVVEPSEADHSYELEDFYEVSHHRGTRQSLRYDSDGHIQSYHDLSDFGLEEVDTLSYPGSRLTSTSWCSCQFFKVFMLPCRHQLRVCIQRSLALYNVSLIGQKWKQVSLNDLLQLRRCLRDTVPPRQRSALPPDELCKMQVAERFTVLVEEFRMLAELGSTHQTSFDHVRAGMDQLLTSVRSLAISNSVTDGLPAPAAQVSKRTRERSKDQTKLLEIFGSRLQAAPCPDPDLLQPGHGVMLVGHSVLYKWTGVGWIRGLILRCVDDPTAKSKDHKHKSQLDNFDVEYPADEHAEGTTVYSHALTHDSYVSAPGSIRSCPVHSWCLLENKPLSVADTSTIKSPVPPPHKGRLPTVRKAPPHGPTSRRPKHKKK